MTKRSSHDTVRKRILIQYESNMVRFFPRQFNSGNSRLYCYSFITLTLEVQMKVNNLKNINTTTYAYCSTSEVHRKHASFLYIYTPPPEIDDVQTRGYCRNPPKYVYTFDSCPI